MKTHKIKIAEQTLARISDSLGKIKAKKEQAADWFNSQTKQLQKLTETNPEFTDQLGDHRETMLAYWRIVLLGLVMCVDLTICSQGMDIICQKIAISSNWKYIVAIGLGVLEIGIAYTSIIKQREGANSTWVLKMLPYAVLLFLVGFSGITTLFEITGYNSQTDGLSFTMFVIVTVFVQLMLLLASVLLHLWIINHSVEIAESVGFLKFRRAQSSIRNDIDRLKKSTITLDNEFLTETQKFARDFQSLKKYYPDEAHELLQTIPVSLRIDMENAMGYPFTAKRRTQQNQ